MNLFLSESNDPASAARRWMRPIAIASLALLTMLPATADGQRVAPLAVVSAPLAPATNKSPAFVGPENRKRFVISAAVGAFLGGAAGFYMAHEQASGTACTLQPGGHCEQRSQYLLSTSVGALLGAVIGIGVGGSD